MISYVDFMHFSQDFDVFSGVWRADFFLGLRCLDGRCPLGPWQDKWGGGGGGGNCVSFCSKIKSLGL